MEQVLKKLTLDFFGQGKHKIAPDKLFALPAAVFLDVRSREEAAALAIPLQCHPHIVCKNIPVDELPGAADEIPGDCLIGVFCPANVRSAIAYAYLLTRGFENVRVVVGGYEALTEALKPDKVFKALQQQR